MARIQSKEIIDQMIASAGKYEDDPAALAIFEFETTKGVTSWSVCYNGIDVASVLSSPHVRNPRLLWPIGSIWQPDVIAEIREAGRIN